MKIIPKLWISIGVLVILSPLGLILPEYFKAQTAWGEWGKDEIQKLIGYIPSGLARLSSLWNALIPDYAFKGWEEKGLLFLSFSYIASAVIGILICVCVTLLLGRFLSKEKNL